MLRISEKVPSPERAVVRLDGQMIGPWVAEAKRVCESHLSAGRALTVDLGEVTFAETSGAEVLSELSERGVVLMNCSPFLAQQLKEFGQSGRKNGTGETER